MVPLLGGAWALPQYAKAFSASILPSDTFWSASSSRSASARASPRSFKAASRSAAANPYFMSHSASGISSSAFL